MVSKVETTGGWGSTEEIKADAGMKHELYIGNLPFSATEAQIIEFFKPYAPVVGVKLLMTDGRPAGKGFITLKSKEDLEKAMVADGDDSLGRTITVQLPRQKGFRPMDRNKPREDTSVIFVGNMAFKSTEESIQDFFKGCGKVLEVRIARNYDGLAKGFAHVEFENFEQAKKALLLNGKELDGRELRIDLSQKAESGGQGFGFQRRGRRGSYAPRFEGGYRRRAFRTRGRYDY